MLPPRSRRGLSIHLPSPVVVCGDPASSRLRFIACDSGGDARRVGIVAVVERLRSSKVDIQSSWAKG